MVDSVWIHFNGFFFIGIISIQIWSKLHWNSVCDCMFRDAEDFFRHEYGAFFPNREFEVKIQRISTNKSVDRMNI